MSIKDDFYIQKIDYNTAQNIIVKCHYSHRKAPYTHAYGLFQRHPNKIVGVVIYGSPASHSLCEGICGFDERHNVYELTRLYVDDGLPKNLESFLVGNTLKLLDKEIIVSFSDTAYDHVGVIYQATNFIYTGLTCTHKDYGLIDKDGGVRHNKAVTVKYGSVDAIMDNMQIDDNLYVTYRSQKHRYIYFNCDKHRRKELLSELRYPILPYPKQSHAVPNTSDVNIFDNIKTNKLF